MNAGSYPEHPLTYRWLAAAYGQLEDEDAPEHALKKAPHSSPKSFGVCVRSHVPWMKPMDYEHMLEGLRKAGKGEAEPRSKRSTTIS